MFGICDTTLYFFTKIFFPIHLYYIAIKQLIEKIEIEFQFNIFMHLSFHFYSFVNN